MPPNIPQDPRAFDSPEFEATEPPTDRDTKDRARSTGIAMLVAVLFLVAVVLLILLL